MQSEAENENIDIELMFSGISAPNIRKALMIPVTRVMKDRVSKFQLYSNGACKNWQQFQLDYEPRKIYSSRNKHRKLKVVY